MGIMDGIKDVAKDLLKSRAKEISNAEELRRNQNIDDVVAALQEAKKQGKNVYYTYEKKYLVSHWDTRAFNDETLHSRFKTFYSVDVTLDSAYQAIYGCTKQEFDKQVAKLAGNVSSALHEDWRKTRLNEDGTFEPRWKAIKDQEFLTSLNPNELPGNIRVVDGNYEIDIANSSYDQLSPDWQYENKEAGKVAAELVIRGQSQCSQRQYSSNDLTLAAMYGEFLNMQQIGSRIHDEWLKRNDWAKGGELDVPFKDLPPHEQAKDIDQYKIAYATFEKMQQKEQAMQNDVGMER